MDRSSGPFFLEAGISSTFLITRSWGLHCGAARKRNAQTQPAVGRVPDEPRHYPTLAHEAAPEEALRAQTNDSAQNSGWPEPGTVIEAAFKAAGLPVPERTGARMIGPAAIIAAALKAAGLRRT